MEAKMPPWSSEHILGTILTSGRPPVGPPVGDGQNLALGSPPGKPPEDTSGRSKKNIVFQFPTSGGTSGMHRCRLSGLFFF